MKTNQLRGINRKKIAVFPYIHKSTGNCCVHKNYF